MPRSRWGTMAAQSIRYHDRDALLCGEIYRPARPNGGAVLIAHEADGIGGNVRRRCAMLAERGYVAFAADLHGDGRVLEGEEMMQAVQRFRDAPDLFRRRVRAGLDALLAQPDVTPARVAAIGYCFGGMAVLELARSGAPLAAVVSFHGLLRTRAAATAGAIKARIAVFTGGRDPFVPPEDIAAFQDEMQAAAADWQLTVYGRALHSFTNIGVMEMADERMRHDPLADQQSWAAAMTFLEVALLPAPSQLFDRA